MENDTTANSEDMKPGTWDRSDGAIKKEHDQMEDGTPRSGRRNLDGTSNKFTMYVLI
jgi:hypothetical protein